MNLMHNHQRPRLFILVLSVLPWGVRESPGEVRIDFEQPQKLSELEKKDIIESSGLAASNLAEDRFWTHNDSGGKPHLFAFDRAGRHLGTSKIKGAKCEDWEDMAAAVIDRRPFLIVGDIGDNRRVRDECQIYFIVEPEKPSDESKVHSILHFRYLGGPVDCEALAYDPVSKSIILAEKTRLGSFARSRVYALPFPAEMVSQNRASKVRGIAKPIGRIAVPTITAMDISRDGRFLVVGSYGESMLFEREQGGTWQQAFENGGKIVHMPIRRQGETICFSCKTYDLFATSEKRPTPLFEIRVRQDTK